MILSERDANTAWPPGKPSRQTDGTLEERTYHCQNWRADVVALMTDAGRLVNQVRYGGLAAPAARESGVPFGIPKTDMDGEGDADRVRRTRNRSTDLFTQGLVAPVRCNIVVA